MSNKSIVPITNETWQTIQSIAPVAQASRMFGVTQEQAAIVMLKGHELGLGLASAFEFIHVIDGKPSISPKGALALIHKSGELEKFDIQEANNQKTGDPESCKVTMKRRGGVEYTIEFTMDNAKKAGVVKPNSGWEKYPANMLRWRALGYCADIVFPDIIGGLYRPEELGAPVDSEGDPIIQDAKIIDVTPLSANEPETVPAELPNKNEPVTLQTILAAGFTGEQIMVANQGKIPATTEECATVLETLQSAK